MRSIHVLVADDYAVVRVGLCSALEEYPDITIVGQASCGDEALAGVRETPVDVVLLDITMPNTVATKCIEGILEVSPSTRVLVLSMHDDPLYMRSVLEAGATGYVTKSMAPSTLIEGVRAVGEGKRFVAIRPADREAGERCAKPPAHVSSDAGEGDWQVADLSPRERQVLTLLAYGHTYQEIADELQISLSSVGACRSRVAVKMGVESRAELVRRAFELGLAGPGS